MKAPDYTPVTAFSNDTTVEVNLLNPEREAGEGTETDNLSRRIEALETQLAPTHETGIKAQIDRLEEKVTTPPVDSGFNERQQLQERFNKLEQEFATYKSDQESSAQSNSFKLEATNSRVTSLESGSKGISDSIQHFKTQTKSEMESWKTATDEQIKTLKDINKQQAKAFEAIQQSYQESSNSLFTLQKQALDQQGQNQAKELDKLKEEIKELTEKIQVLQAK